MQAVLPTAGNTQMSNSRVWPLCQERAVTATPVVNVRHYAYKWYLYAGKSWLLVQKQRTNFAGIVFLDWEKFNQLPQQKTQTKTSNQTSLANVPWMRKCTILAELYKAWQGLRQTWHMIESFNRNAEKQWVRKDCCRSVAAELLSIGRHKYSQTVSTLISFTLSQFIVCVLLRSVSPYMLFKIVSYLGLVPFGLWVTTHLIWVSQGSKVCVCTYEVLCLRDNNQALLEPHGKRQTCNTVCMLQMGNMFLLYGPYCEELAPKRITWLRLLPLTGSFPQPDETVAVYCINNTAIYIRK